MTAHSGKPGRLSRTMAASALTAAAFAGPVLLPGLAQEAAAAAGAEALDAAESVEGSPYRYGGAGPHGFDCSGLTRYSYRQAGKRLPHTAQGQYRTTRHIHAWDRRIGDLVFFHWGRHVYHVGLYAGDDMIWHAPRPGSSVRLERIWSRNVWYGRVD